MRTSLPISQPLFNSVSVRTFRFVCIDMDTSLSKLEHSNLIIGELRASLAESQAHLKAVECELTDTLGTKQEAEARLSAIHSILRRLLGFRQSQYLSRQENSQKAEAFRTQKNSDVSVAGGLDDMEDVKSRNTCDSPRSTEMQEKGHPHLLTDERDSEVETRKMIEKIMGDRMKPELTSTFPEPRRRGRRRLYYESTDQFVPSARQTRSSTRSRRSKSSSPVRERFQSLADRPTSAERQSGSKGKVEDTTSNLHGSGTFGLTGELGLVAVSPEWKQTLRLHRNGLRYHGLPGSDLDPEAVRLVIRAFLRHLVHIERERDTKEMKIRLGEEQILELKQQLAESEQRTTHLQAVIGGTEKEKLDMLEQLANAKLSVSERESLLSKSEKKYDLLHGRYQIVEQQWSICESEKKQLQNRLDKMKTSELRSEEDRRQLLRVLDDLETRYTEAEVARQKLESDLQRAQGVITELEREKQTTQERINAINRQKSELETRIYTLQNARDQMTNNLDQRSSKVAELNVQLDRELREKEALREEIMDLRDHVERMNRTAVESDQERRLLQERLETTRSNLDDTKAQLQDATERLQELQLETSDGAIRRAELESQLRQLTNMSSDSQQLNMDLQNKIAKLQSDGRLCVIQLLDHPLRFHRHSLVESKIDRDRIQQQELCSKLQTENKELLQSTRRLEEENLDLRRDLQKLQAFKTQREETQAARLVEVNTKQRLEAENEMEQQRSALAQAEKALQIRERSHRHRVRCLEEQVTLLKTQLAQEIGRRTLSSSKPVLLSERISPNQSSLLPFGSPTADVELPETLSKVVGGLSQVNIYEVRENIIVAVVNNYIITCLEK
ncbi:rootletin [Paragonimus westermani]|uniref:Rootletin n=1 Tax=Paragonimus westermani TaxID=34504 RepID=A0A5J4NJ80_9TREM|nr:rootletin [Paragonimus westermani]